MKRFLSLVLMLALLAAFALPVFADSDTQNDFVRLISITDDAKLDRQIENPITEKEMLAAAAASEDILPEDFNLPHMNTVFQRRITCEEEICDLALRVWGSRDRYALLFFRPVGSDEWTLIGRNIGEVIDVCMEANGQIAVAFAST